VTKAGATGGIRRLHAGRWQHVSCWGVFTRGAAGRAAQAGGCRRDHLPLLRRSLRVHGEAAQLTHVSPVTPVTCHQSRLPGPRRTPACRTPARVSASPTYVRRASLRILT